MDGGDAYVTDNLGTLATDLGAAAGQLAGINVLTIVGVGVIYEDEFLFA